MKLSPEQKQKLEEISFKFFEKKSVIENLKVSDSIADFCRIEIPVNSTVLLSIGDLQEYSEIISECNLPIKCSINNFLINFDVTRNLLMIIIPLK